MSDQARISSIDALEAFRAELIHYIEKARVALEDMTGEARRTRTWLDVDRTQHWGALFKKLTKQLHQAEEELYSANLTNPHASNALQKMAVASKGAPPQWLSTHPSGKSRIAEIEANLPKVLPLYERARRG